MEIIRAETAGFCFGVENAVNQAFEVVRKMEEAGTHVYTYGTLIHNRSVMKRLEEAGVTVIEQPADISPQRLADATVIIRAHGVAPEILDLLRASGCRLVDATCPYVRKIQRLVKQEYELGRQIVIIGDCAHPEVIGINGWCYNTALVAASLEMCKNLHSDGKFGQKPLSIVAQTTFSKKIFTEIRDFFKNTFDNAKIFDTICSATSLRQQETMKIASQVDLMIVVGSKSSSNTRKLYDLSQELCGNVILVENADELDADKMQYIHKVGVTAGASAPGWIIEEVIGKMSEVNSNENNVAETVEQAAEAAAAEASTVVETPVAEETAEASVAEVQAADEAPAENADEAAEVPAAQQASEKEETAENEGDTFATMLEDSLTTITSGQIVKGVINKIDSKGVYIDLGFKFEGFISIDEFAEVPGFEVGQLNIGDEVEAMVVKVSDKDGEAILSKRRVDYKKNMKLLEESFENKTPITVRVTEAINGGVVAFLGSVRIFIPASQLAERFIKDISSFVGKSVDVIITSFEKGPKGRIRIVGSRKIILSAEREAKEASFWGDMYVGKVCKGVVKSLTPFGAFVDIGGYDGLVHLSELSWRKIRHPQEVVSVGQELEVTVLDFDREKKRISLGYRKASENPWHDAENLYQVGDILEVTVVRFVNFGVFVNIADGIDGLVHISQISNQRITSASECLKLGQKVMAKIIDTNIPEKRINLSIRDVQAYDPEPKPIPVDEEGNPIVPEKREKRRKDRNERRNRKENAVQEESYIDNDITTSSTTIGDILASRLQAVPEMNPVEESSSEDA